MDERLDVEKAALKRYESQVGEIGCRHTHPYHEDVRFERSDSHPSEQDLETFLCSSDFLDCPRYVALILTPENPAGWGWKPELVSRGTLDRHSLRTCSQRLRVTHRREARPGIVGHPPPPANSAL